MKVEQVTTELCKHRFVEVLREYVGPGKAMNYEQAAEALGMDYRTMSCYALGENLPTLPKFLRMCILFGTGFTNRMMAVAGMGKCLLLDGSEVSDFELNANAAAMMGKLGDALRDGRVDARERAQLLPIARRLIGDLQNWVAEHDHVKGEDRPATNTIDLATARRS